MNGNQSDNADRGTDHNSPRSKIVTNRPRSLGRQSPRQSPGRLRERILSESSDWNDGFGQGGDADFVVRKRDLRRHKRESGSLLLRIANERSSAAHTKPFQSPSTPYPTHRTPGFNIEAEFKT